MVQIQLASMHLVQDLRGPTLLECGSHLRAIRLPSIRRLLSLP